jgi:hypothetical protein
MKTVPPVLAQLIAAAVVTWSVDIGHPQAAEYTLMPSPQTVNIGNFNAASKPALTIESGDTVVIETAAAMEPAEIDQSGVVPTGAVPQYVRDIYREVKDRGPGPHILTGPVFVNGAMPGDVLEVRILEISRSTTATTASVPMPARCRRNFRGSFSASCGSTARPRPRRSRKVSWSR